jgi:hypothetical protein
MDKHPLQTMIEEAGFKCQDYSGRGMFGARCLGVVCRCGDLGSLLSELMRQCLMSDPEGGDEYDGMMKAAGDMKNICWDNMGLDMIYYWPDVPFVGDEEEEEEDDA